MEQVIWLKNFDWVSEWKVYEVLWRDWDMVEIFDDNWEECYYGQEILNYID